jgi:uncharacterized protein (DUF486 family)
MDLAKIIEVVGWIFTVIPMVIYVSISVYVLKGAMKDDDLIKALVMIGLAMFFIGATILILMYMTNVLDGVV